MSSTTTSGQQQQLSLFGDIPQKSGTGPGARPDYVLKWYNSQLIIEGPENKRLESKLAYTKKTLELDRRTFSRKTVFRREKVYNKTYLTAPTATGVKRVSYQTLQGLIDLVRTVLEKDKSKPAYVIEDYRIPLDAKPQWHRMHGFRFNQKELLVKALSKDRSGLVCAPTRYGKTTLITNTLNAYPDLKSLVLAPGVDLLPQLVEAIRAHCPDRDVRGIFTGSKDKTESDDITVCSLDSMHKLDKESYKLVLIDEPHTAVSDSRAPQLVEFSNARLLGWGATVSGRWGGEDLLIEGIIGPILAETTYTECVKMGALCPIHVYMLRMPYTPAGYAQRNAAYSRYLFNNSKFHETVGRICNEVIPPDWQTLIFIDNEKEAHALQSYISQSFLAMDKLMRNKAERHAIFDKLKRGEIMRCICSNIYSTGVTIDNLKCEINCDDGGGSILSIQKPGRLAEIKPGKKEGVMLDFLFTANQSTRTTPVDLMIQTDAFNRLKVYQEKGYTITIHDTVEDLKQEILKNNGESTDKKGEN